MSPLVPFPSLARRNDFVSEFDILLIILCHVLVFKVLEQLQVRHLSRHHKDIWDAYVVDRDRKKNAKVERKLKEVVNYEMENAELRFTDLRSNAG